MKKTIRRKLVLWFALVLCTTLFYEGNAQPMIKNFKNQGESKIDLYVGNTLLGSIDSKDDENFTVNLGDKITVKTPENSKLSHPPIYINEVNSKRVRIHPKVPYWGTNYDGRIKKEGLVDFGVSCYGIDLLAYNPMAAVSSFSPGRIFQGLTDGSTDYVPRSGKILVRGFDYTGTNNIGEGENSEQTIIGIDKFQEKWGLSVKVEDIPIKPGLSGGADLSYSEMKKHSLKTTDIFFTTNQEKNVYSIPLVDEEEVTLTDGFIEDVEDLEDMNDAKNFIKRYGTHYCKNVTYGGHYNSYVVISESDYYSAESKDLNIGLSVKKSKPGTQTQVIKSPDTLEISGSPKSSSGGSGGINFAYSQDKEVRDILNNSINKYYFVGGNGNFNNWVVNEDNAVAIDVEPAYLWRLLYPGIMKTAMQEKDLAPKRELLKKAIDIHLKDLKEINRRPNSRAFKFKLHEIKVLDHSDDANRKVKGKLVAHINGLNKAHSIPLWERAEFTDDIKGDLFYLENRNWYTVKQESDMKGNFKPLTISFSGEITEQDDVVGSSDDDIMKIDGSAVFELENTRDLQSYKFKLKHNILSGTQRFVVEVTIRAVPFLGFGDGTLNRPNGNGILDSNKKSASLEESSKIGGKVISSSGFTLLDEMMGENPKEVKFYGQNGISMDQAEAIAAKNGWKIASSNEVYTAFHKYKLDVYAFGMIEDGRFAVPVQKDHSNFKKGPNIGAVGGNQGFFYTVEESTPTTPSATTSTTQKHKDELFDLNSTYHITDAKHNKSIVTGTVYGGGTYHQTLGNSPVDASWYFLPTGDGYYYIYDLRFNKALIAPDYYNHSSGTSSIYHRAPEGKTNAQWKITASGVAGKYIITNRKHENAIVAGDVADNKIYLQPHSNRQNAYWTFTATKDKAPASKPDPTAVEVQKPTPTTPAPTTGVTKGSDGPDFKETPWLNNDYVRIQNKSNNTHYIHNQWGDLEGGPIQADWLSAQWKFIPYGGLKYIGNFQNRSNPELYLVNNDGKVEVMKNPPNLQGGNLLWTILPEKDGWLWITNSASTNGGLHIENGKAEVGTTKSDLSAALWKIEFGPITGSGIVAAPPKKEITPPEPTNVALNKTTKQSSVFGGHMSKYAVDGKIQGQSRPAHTLRENNPWWEVDLGANYKISQINIFNITDERNKYRTHGLYINVSKTPFTNNGSGQGFAENVFPDTEGNYKGDVTGRYVRVYLAKSEYLNISEVQVMGIPAD
jgi:hypothetical protein